MALHGIMHLFTYTRHWMKQKLGDIIYVSRGVYSPKILQNTNSNSSTSFIIPGGVTILGGFPAPHLSNPNPQLHHRSISHMENTILSGINNSVLAVKQDVPLIKILSQTGTVHIEGFKITNYVNNEQLIVYGNGAAIDIFNSNVILKRCILEKNKVSSFGGGISIEGSSNVEIVECDIRENEAGKGGGGLFIQNTGDVIITNSSISKNIAGLDAMSNQNKGGGIFQASTQTDSSTSKLLLLNCTISGNQVMENSSKGGGIYTSIKNEQDTSGLFLAHCTIVENMIDDHTSAGGGAGVYCTYDQSVTFTHCLIFNNNDVDVEMPMGFFAISEGFNLIDVSSQYQPKPSDTLSNQIMHGDSLYLELRNYVGFAESHALTQDSKVIDKGNQGTVISVLSDWVQDLDISLQADLQDKFLLDQRGTERNDNPDIGAYEYQEISIGDISNNKISICPGGAKYELPDWSFVDESGGAILPHPDGVFQLFTFRLLFVGLGGIVLNDIFFFEEGTIQIHGDGVVDTTIQIIHNDSLSFQYLRSKELGPLKPIITFSNIKISVPNEQNDSIEARIIIDSGLDPLPLINGINFDQQVVIGNVNSNSTKLDFDFRIDNTCLGLNTHFQLDDSNLPEDFQFFWDWEFGDSVTSSGIKDVIHHYSSSQIYTSAVTVSINDQGNKRCETQLKKSFRIYPTKMLTFGNSYKDGMDTTEAFWFEGENSNFLWELDIPKNVIQPQSPFNLSWITDSESSYKKNQEGTVESGCIDLSVITNPVFEMDYWIHSRKQFDGSVLQYKPEKEGAEWKVFGSDTTGINSYNTIGTVTNPGNQSSFFYSWSGEDSTWRRFKHSLRFIKQELGDTLVRFRVLFKSDGTSDELDGFAFDNVFIGENRHWVLVENFTNGNEFDPLIYQELSTNPEPDALIVQYPLGYPDSYLDPDTLNNQNWQDNSSRAIYYGITYPKTVVVDGQYFNRNFTNFNENRISQRALNDSTFRIELDRQNGQISIKALKSFETPLAMRVLIIEKGVPLSSSSTVLFQNVVRAVFPHAAGYPYYEGLPQGATRIETLEPIQGRKIIVNDKETLEMIVFVQNEKTKEIYQTESFPIGTDLINSLCIQQRKGYSPFSAQSEGSAISIFPNPTNKLIKIELGSFDLSYDWKLFDQNGRLVSNGYIQQEESIHIIPVSHLAEGLYNFVIRSSSYSIIKKKISVIH